MKRVILVIGMVVLLVWLMIIAIAKAEQKEEKQEIYNNAAAFMCCGINPRVFQMADEFLKTKLGQQYSDEKNWTACETGFLKQFGQFGFMILRWNGTYFVYTARYPSMDSERLEEGDWTKWMK